MSDILRLSPLTPNVGTTSQGEHVSRFSYQQIMYSSIEPI